MEVSVLLFGIARDIAGSRSIQVELNGETNVKSLKDSLKESYPKLAGLQTFMVAVNNEYAQEEVVLNAEDEIAIIPPVSGG